MRKANVLRIAGDDPADFQQQDANFCERLREAIAGGMEVCPTVVSTIPGTQRPVLGDQRSDSSEYEFI
jgi:hypothetical protein